MNFLKKLFRRKDSPIKSYDDFWYWFQNNEKTFFSVVKQNKNVEKDFFDRLSPKLEELKEGFFYLTGMFDDHTVELVLTPDGNIKNLVFVEELVKSAPKIKGWKFTALKPAMDIEKLSIKMNGYTFDSENLFFYSNDYKEYPDEIDISIIHLDCNEENKSNITSGVYIFLDNYLGELDFINNIDTLNVIGKNEVTKELIPIEKLKSFLIWRQKEFVEKYDGIRYDTENDTYSSIEATLKNGNPLIAIINSTILEWEIKASHPWISIMRIKYDGDKNNGFPDDKTYKLLDKIEDLIMNELKDYDGNINVGRETADNEREIYFTCKDYRKPSKVFYEIQNKFSNELEIEYEIYKDKYWQTFDRYITE